MSVLICVNLLLTGVLLAALFVTWKLTVQVRQLFREVAPIGALTNSKGPQPGDACPAQPFRLPDGTRASPRHSDATRLLPLLPATRPASRTLIPLAQDFSRPEHVDLLFAGVDHTATHERVVR